MAAEPLLPGDNHIEVRKEPSRKKAKKPETNYGFPGMTRDWRFDRDEVLKEVFDLCDSDNDGTLTEKEMGNALRLLGLNPTEPQIREMIIEQNTPKGKLNYNQFVDSLENAIGSWSIFDDLKMAFSVFDSQASGQCNRLELKEHLTTVGDPLAEEEAEEWLNLVEVNNRGDLNYLQLIKEILHKEGWLEPTAT